MPREIISIHIGGCGCDVGTEMWRQLASEHGHGTSPATRKYADGAANTRHNQNGQVSSFFHESVFGSLKPRCVFADTDPSSSISLSVRNPDSMFDREDVLLHKQDCRGNYFEGKSRATACGIANDVVDRITSQLDRCDNPSGFLLHHSFGGGTGSGIGAAVMEMIKDQFPKKTLFEPAVFPSTDSSTSTVEPYNCVFALAATRDLASLTLMLDNQAVFKICREKQRISNPSFADMNRVIANVISGCTASLRAPSSLNASLDEIVTNLVPDPTFRYPIVAMAPFSIAKSYGTRELITNLFDSSSCLCDVPNLRLNRYFSATVLCRGPNPIPVVEVQKVVHSLKGDSASHRQPIKFVPWVPNSFKVGIVDSSTGLGSETQLVMLANSTAVRSLFLRQYRKFLELFYHRAYVWQFLEAGGEVDDFMDAKEAVRVIMDRYEETLSHCADEETRTLTRELRKLSTYSHYSYIRHSPCVVVRWHLHERTIQDLTERVSPTRRCMSSSDRLDRPGCRPTRCTGGRTSRPRLRGAIPFFPHPLPRRAVPNRGRLSSDWRWTVPPISRNPPRPNP